MVRKKCHYKVKQNYKQQPLEPVSTLSDLAKKTEIRHPIKLKKIFSKKGHRILKKAESISLSLSSYKERSDILMEKIPALVPRECCYAEGLGAHLLLT